MTLKRVYGPEDNGMWCAASILWFIWSLRSMLVTLGFQVFEAALGRSYGMNLLQGWASKFEAGSFKYLNYLAQNL